MTNVEEPGTATIDWRQPEVNTELTAGATDPDKIDGGHDVRVVGSQGEQADAY